MKGPEYAYRSGRLVRQSFRWAAAAAAHEAELGEGRRWGGGDVWRERCRIHTWRTQLRQQIQI